MVYTFNIFDNEIISCNNYLYELKKCGTKYYNNSHHKNHEYKFIKSSLLSIDVSELTTEISKKKKVFNELNSKINKKLNIDKVSFESIKNFRKCTDMKFLYSDNGQKKIYNSRLSENELYNKNEYYLSQIKKYYFKEKGKYIFMIRDNEKIFRSNYFFEVEINNFYNNIFNKIKNSGILEKDEAIHNIFEYLSDNDATIKEDIINLLIENANLYIKFKVGVMKYDNKNYANMVLLDYKIDC